MDNNPSTRSRGQAGEERAEAHLLRAGLEILERNVTLAGAEVDIVAADRDARGELTVVFVEVRSRADDRCGHPFETVDARKQARVRRAATAWLLRQGLLDRVAVRFDVIAIVDGRVEWLRGCF